MLAEDLLRARHYAPCFPCVTCFGLRHKLPVTARAGLKTRGKAPGKLKLLKLLTVKKGKTATKNTNNNDFYKVKPKPSDVHTEQVDLNLVSTSKGEKRFSLHWARNGGFTKKHDGLAALSESTRSSVLLPDTCCWRKLRQKQRNAKSGPGPP